MNPQDAFDNEPIGGRDAVSQCFVIVIGALFVLVAGVQIAKAVAS